MSPCSDRYFIQTQPKMSIRFNGTVPIYTTPNGTLYIAGGNYAKCTVSACPVELSVYGYRPSLVVSGVVIALYSIIVLVQFLHGVCSKSWCFMAPMVLGCVDEIIGYIGGIMLWQIQWIYHTNRSVFEPLSVMSAPCRSTHHYWTGVFQRCCLCAAVLDVVKMRSLSPSLPKQTHGRRNRATIALVYNTCVPNSHASI